MEKCVTCAAWIYTSATDGRTLVQRCGASPTRLNAVPQNTAVCFTRPPWMNDENLLETFRFSYLEATDPLVFWRGLGDDAAFGEVGDCGGRHTELTQNVSCVLTMPRRR